VESLDGLSLLAGAGIGLLVALIVALMGLGRRRRLKKEVSKLEKQLVEQVRLHSDERYDREKQREKLVRQSAKLTEKIAQLKTKPGRTELRLLRIYEAALSDMRMRAPGFAGAWEVAVKEAEEKEMEGEEEDLSLRERILGVFGG
jgi:hypothetical protein